MTLCLGLNLLRSGLSWQLLVLVVLVSLLLLRWQLSLLALTQHILQQLCGEELAQGTMEKG